MGHSEGAHVMCEYLSAGCHGGAPRGLVLMSPVDGEDPYGLIDNYCVTPGEELDYEIPTLVLPAGLDDVPGKNILFISLNQSKDNLQKHTFWVYAKEHAFKEIHACTVSYKQTEAFLTSLFQKLR